jgi:hypothetical protein
MSSSPMAKTPDSKPNRKAVYLGGGLVVAIGAYYLAKKRNAASSAATNASVVSGGTSVTNNAAVAAQTTNPNVVVVNGNGSNGQGNYGDDSSSSYTQALAAQAALSSDLASLQNTPAYGGTGTYSASPPAYGQTIYGGPGGVEQYPAHNDLIIPTAAQQQLLGTERSDPSVMATAQQVYNQVIADKGSTQQALVAAALVSGIESDGSPTELAGGKGPAEGLFQFEPSTWTGGAGGGRNGLPATVGAATWQQQVQGFINDTGGPGGSNFGAWGPDVVANRGDPNSSTNPDYGYSGAVQQDSVVGKWITSNEAALGSDSLPLAPDGTASGSNSAASSNSQQYQTLGGVGAVLQELDALLNPNGPGLLSQITSLGTSSIATVIEEAFFRGIFTVAGLAIAYMGVKQITGGGGKSVIDLVQQGTKNDLAQQRIDASNAETARKAGPQPVRTTRHEYGKKESTITYQGTKSNPIAPAAGAASGAGAAAAGAEGIEDLAPLIAL